MTLTHIKTGNCVAFASKAMVGTMTSRNKQSSVVRGPDEEIDGGVSGSAATAAS